MSWDRIAFSPLFRVEQFEPKVKRGDWYLTKEGKWWVKYPTEECRIVVETALDRLSKGRKFLFFDDAKSDKANTLQAAYFMSRMAVKFKKMFAELDKASWLNEKTRIYALGDGLYFMVIPCICSGTLWPSTILQQRTGLLHTWQAWESGRIRKS